MNESLGMEQVIFFDAMLRSLPPSLRDAPRTASPYKSFLEETSIQEKDVL
ncbi:hypothetical protein LC653_45315 [Nostoc sp. CHAB 5784]|nr:hypothetical protein [Nostoc mirabile]MCC5670786.1 hypothetical protein [Nostoc mirabile CHAB5784]